MAKYLVVVTTGKYKYKYKTDAKEKQVFKIKNKIPLLSIDLIPFPPPFPFDFAFPFKLPQLPSWELPPLPEFEPVISVDTTTSGNYLVIHTIGKYKYKYKKAVEKEVFNIKTKIPMLFLPPIPFPPPFPFDFAFPFKLPSLPSWDLPPLPEFEPIISVDTTTSGNYLVITTTGKYKYKFKAAKEKTVFKITNKIPMLFLPPIPFPPPFPFDFAFPFKLPSLPSWDLPPLPEFEPIVTVETYVE